MTGKRFAHGGRIDRTRPLSFSFDGRGYSGFTGDTLASALMGAGVGVVGRSFKYHRPRGLLAAGAEETNAIMQVGVGDRTRPNLKATQVPLVEGLVARSVNTWPNAAFDVRAVHDRVSRLLPAGFYYKTFMWPSWRLFEGSIRRAAGLGIAPSDRDPDVYDHAHLSCDLLIVGGGPAGLAAALSACESGLDVVLADEGTELGGALLWRHGNLDGVHTDAWRLAAVDQLKAAGARVLTRTTVFGAYDHRLFGAVQEVDSEALEAAQGKSIQRYWKIRARSTILATGAHERPLVFSNNDRPGVMLASAAEQYATRYGVKAGDRAVVFTTHDDAYVSALNLRLAGVEIVAIVDSRPQVRDAATPLRDLGVPVLSDSAVTDVLGTGAVRGAVIARRDGTSRRVVDCDLIAMSGGWSPAVHLYSQAGGGVRFCDHRLMFVPAGEVGGIVCAGAAAGTLSLDGVVDQGWQATMDVARALDRVPARPRPLVMQREPARPGALGFPVNPAKAFVDFANDVTAADVALAARENFVSVEHLKRYTTLGMGIDQGKTSNVNGLALMGELTHRSPGGVGVTRFRPPYSPITLGALVGPFRKDLARPRRRLPAESWHRERGALMEDYGWERPAAYPIGNETLEDAARREALTVRRGVGVFDGSPLGKIEVSGPDAARFLDRVYVGTASSLKAGRARYGLMLDENGVVIDDGVFVRLTDQLFVLHATSSAAPRVAAMLEEWLQCEWTDLDVVVVDRTERWANLTLSGPGARGVMWAIAPELDVSAEAFPHMSVRDATVCGMSARVLRASFTGEVSYEINVAAGSAAALYDQVWAAGIPSGLTPYGIEALMILRTEKGYLHIGADTDGTTMPDDVGMAGGVSRKASDFIGRRSLSRPDAIRLDRLQLVGLASEEPGTVLPVGAQVLSSKAPPCTSHGFVTSSCHSPVLGRSVALGLVRSGRQRMGEKLMLHDRGRNYPATVVATTAFDPANERLNG